MNIIDSVTEYSDNIKATIELLDINARLKALEDKIRSDIEPKVLSNLKNVQKALKDAQDAYQRSVDALDSAQQSLQKSEDAFSNASMALQNAKDAYQEAKTR